MTIQKAIQRGQVLINGPIILLMGMGWFGTLWYAESIGVSGAWSIAGFLVSLVVVWLYWSLVVPKWLLWAYDKVDNKAALRYRAEQVNLLWPRGHSMNNTMILSAEDKQRMDVFEEELNKQNIHDIPTNKQTMMIYISTGSYWAVAFIMAFLLLGGSYLLIESLFVEVLEWKYLLMASGMTLAGMYGLFRRVPLIDFPPFIDFSRKFFNKEPQIEIYEKGISIKAERTGIIPWKEVYEYNIEYDKGAAKMLNLRYKITEEKQRYLKIDLDNFSIDSMELEGLLEHYIYGTKEDELDF